MHVSYKRLWKLLIDKDMKKNLMYKAHISNYTINKMNRGEDEMLPGTEPNRDAAAMVEKYLEMQEASHLPTSMADVQSRYQAIPYGWREIDMYIGKVRANMKQLLKNCDGIKLS